MATNNSLKLTRRAWLQVCLSGPPSWAGENDFRTVVATVSKGNARALRFYQKYGFKPANRACLDGPDDSVVLMKEVELAPAPGALLL